MTAKVPIRDSGTATLGMIVAVKLRRKRKMTSTTSAMVSISSNCTSCTEARMVVVWSVSMLTSTAGGSVARSWGNRALMRSTTWMMLAPGWRWTLTMTAGTWFIHAAWLMFSTSSTDLATSLSMTGAPLR